MENKKFTLFLMTQKGLVALRRVIDEGYSEMIDKVVISHDKNTLNDYYEEILRLCLGNRIPVFDRKEDITITSEYCIAISWRWMIDINKKSKLIVLHDSLLPRYRGFSPLVNMLLNREPYIGVTALFACNEYDKGDIIEQKKVRITYPIKIIDAIKKITPLYSEILCNIFKKTQQIGKLNAKPQNELNCSYSLWRSEDDYRIDWSLPAEEILQFVYSVGYPYKGASSFCEGELVRIKDCETYDDVKIENRNYGKVIFIEKNFPIVVCGKGLLKLTDICNDEGDSLLPLKKFRVKFE